MDTDPTRELLARIAELEAAIAAQQPKPRAAKKDKEPTGLRLVLTALAPLDPANPLASRFHKETIALSEPIAFKSPTDADRIMAVAEMEADARAEALMAEGYKCIVIVRRFRRLSSEVTETYRRHGFAS